MSASKVIHSSGGPVDFHGRAWDGSGVDAVTFSFLPGGDSDGRFKVKFGSGGGSNWGIGFENASLGFIDMPSTGGKPLTFGFGTKGGAST